MSKPALAVAAFEEASRALLEAHVSLLAENAELKLKLAAAIQRLAVHEPDVTEASLVAAPEISVKKGEEETKKKGDDEAKKKAEDKTEGPSKFRAVKDFLFKSKPKTAEDEAKAKSAKTASKDELFVGDQRKKGSSTKNKPDRWVFLRSMEGHTQAVVDMTLCEYDPFLLASASRDGTVRLWHMEGPAALFCGHKGVVNSVRIHPSSQSRLVCTAGQDGTCQIFRIPIFMVHQRSPKLLDNYAYQPESSPAPTPDGSDTDATPPITPRAVVPSPRMSLTPTNTAAVDPTVMLPAASVLRDHEGEVVACDWLSSMPEVLVSGGRDSMVRVWDVNTQQSSKVPVQFPQGDSNYLTNMSSHPSQPIVLGPASDGLCRVWDLREMKLCDLICHTSERASPVTHAVFSCDGGLIITGGDDRLVKLWDARSTAQPLDAIRCASVQTRFSLSIRTNTLAIPMRDSKIKICDTQGYNVGICETQKQHRDAVTAALWSEDESYLITSSSDEKNNLCVWQREPTK